MGKSKNDFLLGKVSGHIGKQIVIRQYKGKTVFSAYPDMSKVKPSPLQKSRRSNFAKAVKYAQDILHDPRKKAAYARKVKQGKSVYHFALQEYLGKNKS